MSEDPLDDMKIETKVFRSDVPDDFWEGKTIVYKGVVTVIQEECPLSLIEIVHTPLEKLLKVPGVYYSALPLKNDTATSSPSSTQSPAP